MGKVMMTGERAFACPHSRKRRSSAHFKGPVIMCAIRGRYLTCALLLAPVVTAPTRAQQPAIAGIPNAPGNANATAKGRIIQDAWDVAYLNGRRGGYVHLVVEEVPHPSGKTIIRASRDLMLSVRRHG